MLLLSKKDIKKVFTMKDAIEADKEAFRLFSEGKSVVPLRTNIPAPKHDGSLLFMPSYVEDMDASAVKIVNVFPHNIDKGKTTTPATVVLIDGETGETSAILDGTYITQLRTGAASGAAFDLLAKKDCRKGALIGTGGQAATQLEAMICARNPETVKVFDLNPERTQAFVDLMNEELKEYGCKIEAAKTSDEAIEDADMIITVTPASKPVFDASKIKKGATISCVGAYQPHMQELDPKALDMADKIYFDSKDAVLAEAGDIIIPMKENRISEKDFTGEIGELVSGKIKGRENDDEIIIFETVGIAVQDLVTAKSIYDAATRENIGTVWE